MCVVADEYDDVEYDDVVVVVADVESDIAVYVIVDVVDDVVGAASICVVIVVVAVYDVVCVDDGDAGGVVACGGHGEYGVASVVHDGGDVVVAVGVDSVVVDDGDDVVVAVYVDDADALVDVVVACWCVLLMVVMLLTMLLLYCWRC